MATVPLPVPKPTCLKAYAEEILTMLKQRSPKTVPGVTKELHELPPFIAKVYWTELGNLLKQAERPPCGAIGGEKWLSFRLDGNGFSKYVKTLRRAGILSPGFSDEFGEIMKACVDDLMSFTHAWAGYTQSDEMVVLVPPARVIRGQQMQHLRNGRVQKLASLNAARVTAVFNNEVMKLCVKKGLPLPDRTQLAAFDCRVGCYDTEREAVSLLWWRSYDSGINGVTDACFHQKGTLPGAKKAVTLGNDQKLTFLLENSLLPLRPHQAYGSFFLRKRVPHVGINALTNEEVVTTRSKTVLMEGCLLTMFKNDLITYVDEREQEEGVVPEVPDAVPEGDDELSDDKDEPAEE
eukprot:TRINITY_DN33241_c0_g1_i1.p1 TRINITY_DN33241_c0_g1~~TRINITY_DN33241_c0_g1_i1.p1  ORF type:complete len:350 (+),score=128.88 TRINITY_DN33241_c0_g1_i1:51-1100(+)